MVRGKSCVAYPGPRRAVPGIKETFADCCCRPAACISVEKSQSDRRSFRLRRDFDVGMPFASLGKLHSGKRDMIDRGSSGRNR